jgi:hypothetical protein
VNAESRVFLREIRNSNIKITAMMMMMMMIMIMKMMMMLITTDISDNQYMK